MLTPEKQQEISNVTSERMHHALVVLRTRKLALEQKRAEISQALHDVDGDIEVLERELGIVPPR